MSTEVELVEKRGLEIASVRGDAAHAVRETLALDLPVQPNTVTTGTTHSALWLGPDEWLVLSNGPRDAALEVTLRRAFKAHFATVVDLSSGYKVFDARGSGVRAALAAGCPLDIHPLVFGAGQCAQSHFFKAGIILRPLETGAFELVVRASFADYTVRLLLDR